jgi:hypothetical protein
VENFWETGYGMPGFTLLGPRIIRFPWILTSSYPHEILHNWWGNSVYVDPAGGNWCEGLTAYMADHLFAEQRGEADVYRRATLKKFTDFVKSGEDVPLSAFRSRHSPASEAVGYGKSLMLFHMARRALGDEPFGRALSRVAEEHRFRRASFDDLAAELDREAGGVWSDFFSVWVSRTGAPRIEIARAEATPTPNGEQPWEVTLALRQVQTENPFPLTVPVVVTVEGGGEPVRLEIEMEGKEASARIFCPSRPLRLDVDPEFDCMRRLDPLEVPPALSTLFGAEDPLFVIPEEASEEERRAWSELAGSWVNDREPRIVTDAEPDRLPRESIWLLGWSNRRAGGMVERLGMHEVKLGEEGITVQADLVPRRGHSAVLVGRHPEDPELAIGWVTADPVDAIPGLARKLPHYTRYSYLGFRGDEPQNIAKGMWEPVASPLVRSLAEGPLPDLQLPGREPLVELPPAFDSARLVRTVQQLASEEMNGRGLDTPGLARATDWVEEELRSSGLTPPGDGFRQSWSWTGGEPRREMTLVNLVGRIPGTDPALRERPVLVLAHLDHLGRGWPDVREGNRGRIHPGADDNASGVAVLIALARAMAAGPAPARPVDFAVVTGEEAGRIGSKRLLESLAPDRLPFACVNLDTVGRLNDGKLLVLNADSAREWRFIFMGVQYTTGIPTSIVTEPLDSSDQTSCLERGVPAVQLFTGPHEDYHRPSDTTDRIDAEGLAKVSEATLEVVYYLAGRGEPLTVTIDGAKAGAPSAAEARGGGGRRVSLGTMPDFSFPGPGVRVQQVMPDSAAEKAGLIVGDVILFVDGDEVTDLRTYSALLKKRQPGDEIALTVLRDGEKKRVSAVLRER